MADNGDFNRSQLPLMGVIVCCTNIPPEKRSDLASIASQMGAVHKLDLTSDVTHLIVGDSNTPKYKYVAKERPDVKCLLPEWIEAVRQSWIEGGETAVEALEAQYAVPVFAGLRVCVTGFEDLVLRKKLEDIVNNNGGEYRGDLTKEVTHLIALNPTGNKYNYAKQWGIRTVSIEWLQNSLERGMILEENIYDPLLPATERGRNAWARKTTSTSSTGKRDGDCENLPNPRRKLRRTASAKLNNQNDGIWTDIVGAGLGSEEIKREGDDHQNINIVHMGKSALVQLQSDVSTDSPIDEAGSRTMPQDCGLRIAGPAVQSDTRQGLFQGKWFYVHGFDSKKITILQDHLRSHNAEIASTLLQLSQASSPSSLDSSFLLVPHTSSDRDIPATPDTAPQLIVVTDMWIERCLFSKKFLKPEENILNMPFQNYPIPEFTGMVVSSTSFEGIDLLHVSKAVKLMGAIYDEFLTPETSVLICNSSQVGSEKLRHALEWNVPVVTAEWFWSCIRAGKRKPFDGYIIKSPVQTTNNISITENRRDAEEKDIRATSLRKKTHGDGKTLLSGESQPHSKKSDMQKATTMALDSDVNSCITLNAAQSKDPVTQDIILSEDPGTYTLRSPHQPTPLKESSIALQADLSPLHELSPNSSDKISSRLKSTNFESEIQKRASLSTEITSLLAHHQRDSTNPPPANISEPAKVGRRKRHLFGRAPSNLSARSVSLSRASSVDTMNTDGLGTPLETVFPKSKARNDESEKGRDRIRVEVEQRVLLGYDEEEEEEKKRMREESMQGTQLGYEDPDAELWRERLVSKMGGKKKGSGATKGAGDGKGEVGKVKGIGTVKDEGGVRGQAISRRTRHAGGR